MFASSRRCARPRETIFFHRSSVSLSTESLALTLDDVAIFHDAINSLMTADLSAAHSKSPQRARPAGDVLGLGGFAQDVQHRPVASSTMATVGQRGEGIEVLLRRVLAVATMVADVFVAGGRRPTTARRPVTSSACFSMVIPVASPSTGSATIFPSDREGVGPLDHGLAQ